VASVERMPAPTNSKLLPRLAGLISGEWRYVPILVAIVLIWAFFGLLDPKFLSPRNLSNLSLQCIVTAMLALGLVPVLIIRQIDMSVAAISAVAATIAGQLLIAQNVSVWLAIAAGIAFGALVGLVQGRWITWTRTPAFLVTFGVSLVLAAVQLKLLPATGQINLFGTDITFLAGSYIDKTLSWGLAAVALVIFVAFRYASLTDARKAGLDRTATKHVVAPALIVAAVLVVVISALNRHNGVPVAVLILFTAIIVLSYIGKHTRFGIYLYATGANPSAVVRAGIKVDRIRMTAFVVCGAFAAFGGILAASRLLGVSAQSSGMGTLLLEAITAAVVGGTSLFGGRGSPWSALFGALAITSISNGIDLLGLGTEVKLATQGIVLVLATSVDSLAHRFAGGRQED
jgi:ABC-type xylose transport system, permease component